MEMGAQNQERERERERDTEATRLKSWLRRPKTSPQRRIRGGAMGGKADSSKVENGGRMEWNGTVDCGGRRVFEPRPNCSSGNTGPKPKIRPSKGNSKKQNCIKEE